MDITAWNFSRLISKLRKDFPNEISTTATVGNDSTSPVEVSLGFGATLVSLYNPGSDPVFFDLMSSQVTTGHSELFPMSRIELSLREQITKMFLYTPTTSSPGRSVDVLALGM